MSKIFNVILCVIIIFMLVFCWTYLSLKNSALSAVLAAIVSACSCYILWQASTKWENGKNAKQKYKKQLSAFSEYLQFNADNASLLSDMLAYYGFEVTEKLDYDGCLTKKNGRTCLARFVFAQDTLGKDALRQCVLTAKRKNCDKLYIFCNKCDKSLQSLANEHIETAFVDVANTYALFEQCGKLPNFPVKKAKKTSFVANYAFNKKRFGWYAFSSVFTLALSAISYLRYYLLVWATAFFLLAVYSLFNKKHNPLPTQITLD